MFSVRADLLEAFAIAADVCHVVAVRVRLGVVLAALDPEDEQDDDDDRRRRPARRAGGSASGPAAAATGGAGRGIGSGAAVAHRAAALRDRLLVRLVEEVELEVVVTLLMLRNGRVDCSPSVGSERSLTAPTA